MTTRTTDQPISHWQWTREGPIERGSEAHKELFCRMLLDTHDRYKPAAIDWPTLDGAALDRLTGLPFWDIAVRTEDRASARIRQMATQISDPLIRQAMDLMAFEENRHRDVLSKMIRHYGIVVPEEPPYTPPPNAEWCFMSTGYGECIDSFFAFGLFDLAKRSGYFAPELVEVFEPVIQEEARHLVFFVNWAAYVQANKPLWGRPAFLAKRLAAVIENAWTRLELVKRTNDPDFAREGPESIGVKLAPRAFLDLCLSENVRRMDRFDERLLRPWIMPSIVRLARPFVGRN